jgi:DNA-binding response OmpR family regulator
MPEFQKPILLVDDDTDLRNLLERVLIRNGLSVRAASDGKQAITLLDKEHFSLVITDIIMPNVEGIELILRIRKEHPSLPIIAMSAGGRVNAEGYLKMARSLGANQILEKPFSIDVFIAEIRKLLPSQTDSAPASPSRP